MTPSFQSIFLGKEKLVVPLIAIPNEAEGLGGFHENVDWSTFEVDRSTFSNCCRIMLTYQFPSSIFEIYNNKNKKWSKKM